MGNKGAKKNQAIEENNEGRRDDRVSHEGMHKKHVECLRNLDGIASCIAQLHEDRNSLDKQIVLAERSKEHVEADLGVLQKRFDYFRKRLEEKYERRDKFTELLRVYEEQKSHNAEHARQHLMESIEETRLKWAFSQKDVRIQESRLAKMNEYLDRHDREYEELQEAIGAAEKCESPEFLELRRKLDALKKKIIAEEQEKGRIQRDLDLTRKEEKDLSRSLNAKRNALETLGSESAASTTNKT